MIVLLSILSDIVHASKRDPLNLSGENLYSLLVPVQVKIIIRQDQIFILIADPTISSPSIRQESDGSS